MGPLLLVLAMRRTGWPFSRLQRREFGGDVKTRIWFWMCCETSDIHWRLGSTTLEVRGRVGLQIQL